MREQYAAVQPAVLRFGAIEINQASRILSRAGAELPVETKTLDLLLMLAKRAGEVCTKDALLAAIWPGRIVSESVLAKCVVKARVALGDEASALKTVHGIGYRLDAVVECGAPSRSPVVVPPPVLQAGASVPGRGHWRLVRGMGAVDEVWLAEHGKTGERRVFKFGLDAAGVEALRRELTINRLLREAAPGHPGFVFVADWNLDAVPPYLEMPCMPGRDIAAWLEAHGGAGAVPLERRLDLLAQAAEALAAAHALGIVHRDLKPGNLLVDDDDPASPCLKLADFGISALTEPERLEALAITRMDLLDAGSASPAGTLAYVAPEVLAGQPQTVAADIYALGVLLYQLAAGDLRRSLAPGWERRVDDELLRDDIAAAADLDPTHRLGSAAEFARRLRSLPERRIRRGVEREAARRLAAAEAALGRGRLRRQWAYGVAATMALGLAVSIGLYLEAMSQQHIAERALATSEAVIQFIDRDILGAANPLRAGGGREVTVASLLDKAAAGLHTQLRDQPETAQRLAYTVARSYQNLGLGEEGRKVLLAAIEAAGDDDAPYPRRLRFLLADIDTEVDRYDESAAVLDRLLADIAIHDEQHGDFGFDVRASRAWLDFELGHYEQSAAAFDAVLADLRRWRPDDRERRLTAQWWSVDSLLELGQVDEADRRLAEVLDHYRAEFGENHARYLWARMSLGNVRTMQRRFDEAEAILADVQRRVASTLGEGHNIGLFSMYFRGVALLQQGRPAQALPLLERSYRLRNEYQGANFHATWLAANRYGQALSTLGRMDEARRVLAPAREAALRAFGPAHPYTLRLATTQAACEWQAGNEAAAAALVREALAQADLRLPHQHVTRATLLYQRGVIERAFGRSDAAAQSLSESATMFKTVGYPVVAEMTERLAREADTTSDARRGQSANLPI